VTMRLTGWLVLSLAVGLLMASCSSDDDNNNVVGPVDPGEPEYTAAELDSMGWYNFTLGEYTDALLSFQEALDQQSDLYSSRLGLGWALAHTDEHEEGVAAFDVLLAAGELEVDAHAGRAAATLFIDPQSALTSAETALGLDADYIFSRRPSFDYLDLHLIVAEANYYLQNYAESQEKAEFLEPSVGLEASNLDESDPSTWVIDTVTYDTYVEALAVLIERISLLLAADDLPEGP